MTDKVNAASAFTHEGNDLKLKVEDGDSGLENSQAPMMLIDADDFESGLTHSQDKPTMPGATKAPTTAATKPAIKPAVKARAAAKPVKANGMQQQQLVDKELPAGAPSGDGVNVALIDNETDPAAGYLEKEAGLPVINNASLEGLDADEFESAEDPDGPTDAAPGFEAEVGAELENEEGDEFDDLPSMSNEPAAPMAEAAPLADEDGEEFEDFGAVEPAAAPVAEGAEPMMEEPVEEVADFEAAPVTDEQVPLVDADQVPDTEGSEDIVFATVRNSLHVIRSNRIIASMGPAKARKLGMSDIYLSDQFQDVLAHAIDTKGLRKGLIQQGLTLAKVKMTASQANAKVIKAKVEAGIASRMDAVAKQNKALDQSLAIAAVGINKRYFKDADNSLKASLVEELKRAGVKGASQLVASCFAEHGVAYARSILSLANRIAAMPEEVRNNHADSLDMTSDEDFEEDAGDEVESSVDEEEDEFNPVAATVTAALGSPSFRRSRSSTPVLSSALSFLQSDQPLA